MDRSLIKRILAFLQEQQRQLEEAQAAAEKWKSEALVQEARADKAEEALETCQTGARRLSSALNDCQKQRGDLEHQVEQLEIQVARLEAALDDCGAQPTLVTNQSTKNMTVVLGAGDRELLQPGESKTFDDAGGSVTVSGG